MYMYSGQTRREAKKKRERPENRSWERVSNEVGGKKRNTVEEEIDEEEEEGRERTKLEAHSHLCDAVAVARISSPGAFVSMGYARRSSLTASALWVSAPQASSPDPSSTIDSAKLPAPLEAPVSTRRWCRKLHGSFCPGGTCRSTWSPRHLKSLNVRSVLLLDRLRDRMEGDDNGGFIYFGQWAPR